MPKPTITNKGIIRVQKNRENPYVMMNKSGLNDPNLSFKAKGILAYLLSKPDNWQVIVGDLIKQATDGRDSIYAGLNELKRYGYLLKYPVRDNKGKVTHWESIIFEVPQPLTENPEMAKKPLTDFPDTENLDTENPEHNNNVSLLNNDYNNEGQQPSTPGSGCDSKSMPNSDKNIKLTIEQATILLNSLLPDHNIDEMKVLVLLQRAEYDLIRFENALKKCAELDPESVEEWMAVLINAIKNNMKPSEGKSLKKKNKYKIISDSWGTSKKDKYKDIYMS